MLALHDAQRCLTSLVLQSGLWRKSRHIVAHHIVLIFCMWLGVFKVRRTGRTRPWC